MTLPRTFYDLPFAHRGLHDVNDGRPENSRAAIRAAIAGGYGIEMDVQLSADGAAMVFHDYALDRLTGQKGVVRQNTAAALGKVTLIGNDEGVPGLAEVLELVAGQVPLLIELKDQDGEMGPNIGALEEATGAALTNYSGDAAVMSFNPHSVARLAELAPDIPRGIVTCSYRSEDWPLSAETRETLRAIPDYDRVGASFISHEWADLERPRVAELKSQGATIFCWTIKSLKDEATARKVADNVTFEGYQAALPA